MEHRALDGRARARSARWVELVEASREQRLNRRRNDHLRRSTPPASPTNSWTNSGLPSAAATIALRIAASERSPRRADHLLPPRGASGSSSSLALTAASPPAAGRAAPAAPCRQQDRRPGDETATCSIRSRNVPRPTGCRRRRPRAAAAGGRLDELAERPRELVARGATCRLAEQGAERAAAAASRSAARAAAHDLDHGPVGDPLPVGEAPAATTARVERRQELGHEPRLADARRPRIVTSSHAPRTRPSHASRASQLALPPDQRRVEAAGGRVVAETASSRHAGTGSALPFSASGSTGSASTASPARRIRPFADRISPGCAACSSRAAS